MFTIYLVLLLGIVQLKSELTLCQMTPIGTENGLMRYNCMFSKDVSSKQIRERMKEVFETPHVTNDGKNMQKRDTEDQSAPDILFIKEKFKFFTDAAYREVGYTVIGLSIECRNSTMKTNVGTCEPPFG